jgi:hypothetical protein
MNATISFDWYLDSIGSPINDDYFMFRIRLNTHNMYYYIGSEITGATNGTSAYFMIDGPLQSWNFFHRNLTSDYYDVFSEYPTQISDIDWFIRTFTYTYTRVFIDDIALNNDTEPLLTNGNFENGASDWILPAGTDPADISQSTVAYEGDYSMNMTAISYDYVAYARVSANAGKLLNEDNQGQLSLWWRIDDWINPTEMTYARIQVEAKNATHSFNIYYYLCYGGDGQLPPLIFGNDIQFEAVGFNTTGTWNHFDRNIWTDFNLYHSTDTLYIEQISFYVRANEDDSRLSVLFDEVVFETSIMNDMDYERQSEVGSMLQGWTDPETDFLMTVTDFAKNGEKAANLTLEKDSEANVEQEMGDLQVDMNTELILDFWVYIDEFNESSQDFVFLEFYFDDESLAYVIANSTSNFENYIGEESNFIILQEAIALDQWINFQLDIVHDYETVVGHLPNTTLYDIELKAVAVEESRFSLFLDDLYIYYDPAPEVSDVAIDPQSPTPDDPVVVTATIIDATIETVVLNFRIDSGSWSNIEMNLESGNTWADNFPDLAEGEVVEFSITATDAFGKSTTALNETEYFSFTVGASTLTTTTTTDVPEFPLAAVAAIAAIIAVAVIVVLYMFVYKKE